MPSRSDKASRSDAPIVPCGRQNEGDSKWETERRLALTAAPAIVAALGLSAVASTDSAQVRYADVARLSGAAEVPGPGDMDGHGTAVIRVDTDSGEICYRLIVRRIVPATMAHIHIGGPTDAGPVVQGLEPPTDGSSSGCVMNGALADAILANPANYYVNVHNPQFPGGAVRGQLGSGNAST